MGKRFPFYLSACGRHSPDPQGQLEATIRHELGAVSPRGMIKYTLTFVNVNHGSQFQEFLGYEVLPTTIEEDMMDVLIGE